MTNCRVTVRLNAQSHCELNTQVYSPFGTNVLVLGKQRDNPFLLPEPLQTDVNKNVVVERLLN